MCSTTNCTGKITCFGELLVDFFADPPGMPLEEATSFIPIPGGAPANVAVGVARLGRKSAFMGKVGADAFGRKLARVLRANGVDVRGLRFDSRVRTTCAFIAQEFLFFRNPGADLNFCPEDVDTDLVTETAIFHCGSLSLTGEPIRSTLHSILPVLRGRGIFLSFDANYRPSLWEGEKEAYRRIWEVIPGVDLLKVNERELLLLTGTDDPEKGIPVFLAEGTRNVVVTMGREGAFFGNELGQGFVPGFAVETVDATGCGDSFVAGILSEFSGSPVIPPDTFEHLLRFANACGAITATRRGVIPALPWRREVESFLETWERSERDESNRKTCF